MPGKRESGNGIPFYFIEPVPRSRFRDWQDETSAGSGSRRFSVGGCFFPLPPSLQFGRRWNTILGNALALLLIESKPSS